MRRASLVVLVVLLAACPAPHVPAPPPVPRGGSFVLDAPRTGFHANGRIGDLVLFDGSETAMVVASTPSLAGHRPLAGAIVDLVAKKRDDDASDPIEWWRIGWVAGQTLHVPQTARVASEPPSHHQQGCARIEAEADGVTLATRICPLPRGFSLHTDATNLPPDAAIADELQIGTSASLLGDDGGAWTGEHVTKWFAFSNDGLAAAITIPTDAHVSRTTVHWPDEIWPAPTIVRHPGGAITADRRIVIRAGDALDALDDASAVETVIETIDLGPRGGSASLLARPSGREMFRAAIANRRTLHVPKTLACDLELRDSNGIPLGAPRALGSSVGKLPDPMIAPRPQGTLHLSTIQPVHVLFKGKNGTPDPMIASSGRIVGAGFSAYLLKSADVILPTGEYEAVATAGPLATMDRFDVTIEAGKRTDHRVGIAWVQKPSDFVSADFHLHAAPSRDSSTSLVERATSLACEGLDLAVATDHNRITDYAPAMKALDLRRPVVIAGDEITMSGTHANAQYGHFNVFPLPVPTRTRAPEDSVPAYWDVEPAAIAPGARAMGARIVQVNHGRLDHAGFFESAKLEVKTGQATGAFSDDFDAIEVLNGFELEKPEKLRAAAMDLVAFARRGKKIAATGNSDSHALLFQEPGYPRTWVRAGNGESSTLAARVMDAVLRGDTVASSGVLLDVHVNDQPSGSTVRPKNGKVHVAVKAWAASWVPFEGIEIWKDDAVVARAPADPPKDGLRLAWEGDVDAARDCAILVWASSEKPIGMALPLPNARAVAITTPVYVDADGDGRVISAALR